MKSTKVSLTMRCLESREIEEEDKSLSLTDTCLAHFETMSQDFSNYFGTTPHRKGKHRKAVSFKILKNL